MAHLTLERLIAIEFPLPTTDEQAVIVERFRALSDVIAQICDASQDADREALRQSILKADLEGRLVPQDPADEPASVLLPRLGQTTAAHTRPRRRARQLNLAI
jgi:type I restriction enzyme S subunit